MIGSVKSNMLLWKKGDSAIAAVKKQATIPVKIEDFFKTKIIKIILIKGRIASKNFNN